MALEKDMVIDLIQILPDRQIQVRQTRRVLEDGVVIATGPFHRYVLDPGIQTVDDVALINPDLHKIAQALWVKDIVDARKEFIRLQDEARALQVAAITPVE